MDIKWKCDGCGQDLLTDNKFSGAEVEWHLCDDDVNSAIVNDSDWSGHGSYRCRQHHRQTDKGTTSHGFLHAERKVPHFCEWLTKASGMGGEDPLRRFLNRRGWLKGTQAFSLCTKPRIVSP